MGYIEDRIQPRIDWYDRRAVVCKRVKYAIDLGTTLMSILLVLLISIEGFSRVCLSIIAAAIAAMIAFEKIGSFGERWLLNRLSAEALQAEVQLFKHHAGPYAAEPEGSERLLVERIEALLRHEAGRWQALSRTSEPSFERKLGA
jgi:hypothetical protein